MTSEGYEISKRASTDVIISDVAKTIARQLQEAAE